MGGSCKPGLEVCLCIRIWLFDILFPLLEKAAEFIVLGQNHVQVNNSRAIKSELWGSDLTGLVLSLAWVLLEGLASTF